MINIGEAALAAVVAIEVVGHERSGATLSVGTLFAESLHLAGVVNLVELQHSELHLLVLVFDFLRLGVGLLLALLGSAAEAEDKVEGGLLLDVVVGEGAAVLELLSGEDEPLLIRRDALLVLDLGLHIVYGVRRLYFKGDGLPREGFHEYLHRCWDLGFRCRVCAAEKMMMEFTEDLYTPME